VLAHERLFVAECTRARVDVLRRADVAEHHGRVALHRGQLRTLHGRAAERRALGVGVHRQHLARVLARVLARERLTRRERGSERPESIGPLGGTATGRCRGIERY
jgi:hypothetical protein